MGRTHQSDDGSDPSHDSDSECAGAQEDVDDRKCHNKIMLGNVRLIQMLQNN